jgi:hypothetical protein
VIARSAKRIARSMISAVSNRGLMRFMLDEGALNADRFIAFLRRLIKDAGRKVILIVDHLKVHKAHKVQAWAKSHAHAIELFYLPSPDRGPGQALRARPQPDRVSQQRPEAAAAPAAASGIRAGADQAHPIRAARHPALARSPPGLLPARASPLRRMICQV